MDRKPYVTREIVVRTCGDCPFETYTGGIHECRHPYSPHLVGVETSERRRLKGCPLPTQSVLVRAAKGAE